MRKALFLIAFTVSIFSARAQVKYQLNPESTMSITGTSTIHDWTSKVDTLEADMIFNKMVENKNITASGKLIESLQLRVPVKSIISPHGQVMDNKTYEALRSDDYPKILFVLKDDKITAVTDPAANKFTINISGNLTIAGNTRDVTLELSGQKLPGNSFHFDGDYSLKMSDYNITPPTAMFGQIVTGDKVTLAFNFLVETMK